MYERELEFLENHISLLENKDWDYLYQKALEKFDKEIETRWSNICKMFADPVMDINIFELSDELIERLQLAKLHPYFWPYTLVEYKMPDKFLTVPENCFAGQKDLTDIELTDNITRIGAKAFSCCLKLHKIELPDSIKIIGNNAFEYSGIEEIKWPNTDFLIDSYAFKFSDLTKFKPSHICSLSPYAFQYCSYLSEVDFTKIAETIPVNAFWGCDSLKEIFIPKNIKYICNGAFHIRMLDSVTFDVDNTINVERDSFDDLWLNTIYVTTDSFDECYEFFERSNFEAQAFYENILDVVSSQTGEVLGKLYGYLDGYKLERLT